MGFFEKIWQGLARTRKTVTAQLGGMFAAFTGANEEFFEELEETLILADLGVETSVDAVDKLREVTKKQNLRTGDAIRGALAEILLEILDVGDASLHLDTKPSAVLVIGVNGVGKTTTIGKLARKQRDAGKKVLLCAADTFRAASAEQLTVWAERSESDIVRHEEGSDPAAVVFDGCAAAKARGADIVIVDTAGRLHNKSNLMSELGKISRVLDRELPGADRRPFWCWMLPPGKTASSRPGSSARRQGLPASSSRSWTVLPREASSLQSPPSWACPLSMWA